MSESEQDAEGDVAADRVETFDSTAAFLADLEREAQERGLTTVCAPHRIVCDPA